MDDVCDECARVCGVRVEQPFCAHEKGHERCTAILVRSSMLLSVYMPEEKDHIRRSEW